MSRNLLLTRSVGPGHSRGRLDRSPGRSSRRCYHCRCSSRPGTGRDCHNTRRLGGTGYWGPRCNSHYEHVNMRAPVSRGRRNVRLVIVPVPLLLLGTAVVVSIVVSIVVIIMLVVLVVGVRVALLAVPVIIVVVAMALGLALLISRHGGRSVYGRALDVLSHPRV